MDDSLIEIFIQLITNHTGWQIRPQDRSALWQKILIRMKALKLDVPEKYYQLLAAPTHKSQSEWREFTQLLTVNETYFLRDKGQLSLLEKVILPELIEHKLNLYKSLGVPPTLRIWSAGCSTGEEAYSLSILLKQLISDWHPWKIYILGTDLDREVMGATNPANAAEGTIRKLFAESIEANSVHGSDSAENAKAEVAFFFAGIEIAG